MLRFSVAAAAAIYCCNSISLSPLFPHAVSNVKLATLIVEPLATLIVLNGPFRPQSILFLFALHWQSALTNSLLFSYSFAHVSSLSLFHIFLSPNSAIASFSPFVLLADVTHLANLRTFCPPPLSLCYSAHCPSVSFQFSCPESIMLCKHEHTFSSFPIYLFPPPSVHTLRR